MTRRLVLMVLILITSSACTRWDHDPLDVYRVDPRALEIPAVTFAIFPF